MGLYTYLVERIGTDPEQLMAGVRKFKLELIDRTDLVSPTERAREVTGALTPHKLEANLFEQILED